MKWFEGSIAEAVTSSKAKSAVFVVYIEGSDELSKGMTSALNNHSVSRDLESEKFVSIKLMKDSESHKQFTEIYRIVPVPSLFFIGENGVPLEIVAGDKSEENVIKKINAAIKKSKGESVSPADLLTSSDSPQTSQSVNVLEKSGESSDAVPSESTSSEIPKMSEMIESLDSQKENSESPQVSSDPENAKVLSKEELMDYMKKKKEETLKLEEQKEKEREIERRRTGQELLLAKKKQQDREIDEARKEREREKREEAAARERVLRQIKEDQEKRAARLQQSAQTPKPTTQVVTPPVAASSVSSSDSARLQFKLPDGQTRTHTFNATSTIRDLRVFIDGNIVIPFKEYTLATTFPRREFTARDLDTDLRSLELTPSAVILIMPLQNTTVSRGPGWSTAMIAMMWDLFQPLISLGQYIRSLVFGSPPSPPPPPSNVATVQQAAPQEPPSEQQPPPRVPINFGGSRTVRKRGNIHSLGDGNDSNDENNTWNGNSTQLM